MNNNHNKNQDLLIYKHFLFLLHAITVKVTKLFLIKNIQGIYVY